MIDRRMHPPVDLTQAIAAGTPMNAPATPTSVGQGPPEESRPAYAGVGSRETPQAVLETMKKLATELEAAGWRLHSGGADGADAAFQQGTTPESRTIYLPWKGYNDHQGADTVVLTNDQQTRAQAVVAGLHGAWQRCGRGARALHGRNHAIIHGVGTGGRTESVSAVICWTPGGQVQGGTATAIKLARAAGLPVLNLAVATVEEVQQTMAARQTRACTRTA